MQTAELVNRATSVRGCRQLWHMSYLAAKVLSIFLSIEKYRYARYARLQLKTELNMTDVGVKA